MTVTIQLEPGNLFRCSCQTHSLTDYAVTRMSFAQFVCTKCGETMVQIGEVYQPTPDEIPSDTFLACTFSDDGSYTLEKRRAAPHYSYCSVYSPGISFQEAGRRAIVRALYRPGDLDGLMEEPAFKRLFELLNEERISLIEERRAGTLSEEEESRLMVLTHYVDHYVKAVYPRG